MNLDALWSALWGMLGGLLSGGALVYWQRHIRRSGRVVPRTRDFRVRLHRWRGSQLKDDDNNPAPLAVGSIQEADHVTISATVELWNEKDVAVDIRDVKVVVNQDEKALEFAQNFLLEAPDYIAIPATGSAVISVGLSFWDEQVRLLAKADNLALAGYTLRGKPILLPISDLNWG